MRKVLILATLIAMPLAGCVATDGERAAIGGVGAAVASKAFGGSTNDALLAGAAGAAAGALCDDVNLCR